ncbi:MAG: polyphosphate kinase 1, partial [Planctomycetaceae bacterium]|nr:polyphosphate kinase 1 [Planctomycetaceae bacterium]
MKKSKQIYFNRELSWLSFNQRVLDQASRSSNPLLERLKFIAITASNLDEFFMVRVGGLAMVADSATVLDINGWTPTQQLEKIRTRVRQMYADQSECLLNELEPLLAEEGIERVEPGNLSKSDLKFLRNRFHEEMMSSLAPIAIENMETFPALSGARICMCVRLKNDFSSRLGVPAEREATLDQVANRENDRYVLIPMGKSFARFQALPSKTGYRYMLTEDVVGMFLSDFFGEQEIIEWNTLRVTRNGDVDLEEDGRADLLIGMQAMLEARRKSECVRLEISDSTSLKMQTFLQNSIDVQDEDVYSIQGPLGLSDYFSLAGLRGFPRLKDANWPAQPSPEFSSAEGIFQTIARGDRLLYHPYQSYEPIVQFIQAAATDPDVIAVKQTLYRTSESSEIVKALCLAAENGKHVTVIVELKARFDEARNINWARELADAGVDVIYGVRGLKTHAKMCLVVRREPTGIKRYIHFGTGNYNESTAKLYSDASLFTCDEKLGRDSVHFFNAITGLSVPQTLEKLIAAPINLRESLLEMIRIETESA